MQKVKFIRSVSHNGKFYLRGREVMLDDFTLVALQGRYEEVGKPVKKRPIRAQSTAILKPKRTTVMKQPESKPQPAPQNKVDVDSLDWKQLRELGSDFGVYKVGMKKKELIALLKERV